MTTRRERNPLGPGTKYYLPLTPIHLQRVTFKGASAARGSADGNKIPAKADLPPLHPTYKHLRGVPGDMRHSAGLSPPTARLQPGSKGAGFRGVPRGDPLSGVFLSTTSAAIPGYTRSPLANRKYAQLNACIRFIISILRNVVKRSILRTADIFLTADNKYK